MRLSNILSVVPWLLLAGCSFDGFLKAGFNSEETSSAQGGNNRSPRPTLRDREDIESNVSPRHTSSPTSNSKTDTTKPRSSSAGPSPGYNNDAGTPEDSAPVESAPEQTESNDTDTGTDAGTSFTDDDSGQTDAAENTEGDNEADETDEDVDVDEVDQTDTTEDRNDTTSPSPSGTSTSSTHGTGAPSTGTSSPATEATEATEATSNNPSHACETLLIEGFDSVAALPTRGWALKNNSVPLGATGWLQGDPDVFPAHEGDPDSYIVGSFTNADALGTISNWLLTPEVTLENGAVLSFWTRSVGSQFADRLQVRLSTNGDSINVGNGAFDVGDFTHLLLDINPGYLPSEYPATFTRFYVTIRDLAETTTGRFAFRYFVEDGGPMGTNSDFIGLDSVVYPFCGDDTDDTDDTDTTHENDTTSTDVPENTSDDTSDSTSSETNASSYHLTVSEGDAQTGLVGYGPNVTPKVRVTNEHGSGVAGVQVTFAVALGGGSVSGAVQTTDVLGYASPGKWTLGKGVGPNQLTASVSGPSGPQSIAINATGTQSQYNIKLQYLTDVSPEHQAVFEAARERWEGLIIGDLPNVNYYIPADLCGEHPAITTPIDDLLIFVSVGYIDGMNGVLGQAGPCIVRATGSGGLPAAGAAGLPVVGTMNFDEHDLDAMANDGQLEAVILHEMGHVLGLNSTYWRSNGLLQNPMPGSPSNDTHFTGSHAREAFLSVGGATYSGTPVPVENCVGIPSCGQGTYNSHWREFALDNELMTGFISPAGTPNPLSRVTVAALWDVGYAVNLDGADPYYKTFSNLLGLQAMTHRTQLQELPHQGPIYVIDDNGLSVLEDAH